MYFFLRDLYDASLAPTLSIRLPAAAGDVDGRDMEKTGEEEIDRDYNKGLT